MKIERKIAIGLITSKQYLQQLKDIWKSEYIESAAIREVSKWVWEYYNQYNKAPKVDIETIYIQKAREGLKEDIAEIIEQDLLPSLSKEHTNKKLKIDYLVDQTKKYFKQRQLEIMSTQIATLLDKGKINDAFDFYNEFKFNEFPEDNSLS